MKTNNISSYNLTLNSDFIDIINDQYKKHVVYPKKEEIFKALELTPLNKVKVVILGQDPYINEGQAMGLSFSVPFGVSKIPPSLVNIFKEIKSDLGYYCFNTNLTPWANQGVLLLNTCLTVIKGRSLSHKDIGWNKITEQVISKINEKNEPVVWMLWGKFAQSYDSLITNKKHFILRAAHPSPFSCHNFFGCKHFSKANKILKDNGLTTIDWKT